MLDIISSIIYTSTNDDNFNPTDYFLNPKEPAQKRYEALRAYFIIYTSTNDDNFNPTDYFLNPKEPAQKQYEALRAYFPESLTQKEEEAFCIFLSTKPCFFKSCFTTCGDIFIPFDSKAFEISLRLRFVHFISASIGLPAVWWFKISKKTSSIFSSVSIIFFLPPPAFRILSSGISVPLVISLIPAMTVWKWHPSTLHIYFCPPCPNSIASMAAYRLLSFSFKVSKNALIFCSISSGYFMRSNYSIPLLFSK